MLARIMGDLERYYQRKALRTLRSRIKDDLKRRLDNRDCFVTSAQVADHLDVEYERTDRIMRQFGAEGYLELFRTDRSGNVWRISDEIRRH